MNGFCRKMSDCQPLVISGVLKERRLVKRSQWRFVVWPTVVGFQRLAVSNLKL